MEITKKQAEILEQIEKGVYTDPSSNSILTALGLNGKLTIDESMDYIDLVTKQNPILESMNVQTSNSLTKAIQPLNYAGKLVQVADGTYPSDSQYGSISNVGYTVELKEVKFYFKLTREMTEEKEWYDSRHGKDAWKAKTMNMMSKSFSNELTRLFITGSPASGADATIKNNYHWDGSAYEAVPYTSVRGMLDFLKGGYTYGDSATQVNPYATVNTYDSGTSEFRPIRDILHDMIKSYPNTLLDPSDTVFYMSAADLEDYKTQIAEKDASTAQIINGVVPRYNGFEIRTLPYLVSLDNNVTISATDYYGGMIVLCKPNELFPIFSTDKISFVTEEHSAAFYTDVVMACSVGFGCLPQRAVIAYKK